MLSIGGLTAGGCLFADAPLQQLVRNALRRACSPIPKIANFTQLPSNIGTFTLRMEGNPGAGYILEHSANLSPPWTPVKSFNFNTLEGERDIPINNTSNSGFYRVRRQ